jgi:hypothetical protein
MFTKHLYNTVGLILFTQIEDLRRPAHAASQAGIHVKSLFSWHLEVLDRASRTLAVPRVVPVTSICESQFSQLCQSKTCPDVGPHADACGA